MRDDYIFTDLNGEEDLVNEIRQLEEKIGRSIGAEVNLIAYSETEKTQDHRS